jgi:hypothetical protein
LNIDYFSLDEQLNDFDRNDFLSLIEESRSYCAQDLRTSLDIIDVNRLPELARMRKRVFFSLNEFLRFLQNFS